MDDVTDAELCATVTKWLSYVNEDDQAGWPAYSLAINWSIEGSLELGWRFIRECCRQSDLSVELAVGPIGTGPLHDVIDRFGVEAWELVEPELPNSATLRGAVEMMHLPSSPAWPRIIEARRQWT